MSPSTPSRAMAHRSPRPTRRGRNHQHKTAHLCAGNAHAGMFARATSGQRATLRARQSGSEAEHFCPQGSAAPHGPQPTHTKEKCHRITSGLSSLRKPSIHLMAVESQVLARLVSDPQMVIQGHPQPCLGSRLGRLPPLLSRTC